MTEQNYKIIDLFIKSAGFVGVILTIVAGGCQHHQKIEKEFKKPYWEAQLKACDQATVIAANVWPNSNNKISQKKIDDLFHFFYGNSRLYLNNTTLKSIADLGSYAVNCNAENVDKSLCVRPVFNGKAMDIANSCRDMLTKTWNMSLDKLDHSKQTKRLTEIDN